MKIIQRVPTAGWQKLLLGVCFTCVFGLLLIGSSVRITRAELQSDSPSSSSDSVEQSSSPGTPPQVTVIAILVTPGESDGGLDPRLTRIKAQLRKLIPKDHGFKLLDVRNERLTADQALVCDLGDDRSAIVTVIDPLDSEGKIKLRCELTRGKRKVAVSNVSSPLNQLFFCEHSLEDGSKILIGIGAR